MTAQLHENIIINGKVSSMAFCPSLPKDDARISTLSDDDILTEITQKQIHRLVLSTACWREYIGTWEIKSEKFYLVKLEGRFKLLTDHPILADWFTGVIRIPQGKLLHYVHMGFASVYEQELHLKIEAGIVTASKLLNNRDRDVNTIALGCQNLPGLENRFDGDDQL